MIRYIPGLLISVNGSIIIALAPDPPLTMLGILIWLIGMIILVNEYDQNANTFTRKLKYQKNNESVVVNMNTEIKTKPLLFRVWHGYSTEHNGDRSEIIRVLANSWDEVSAFVKKKMLKPETIDEVTEDGDIDFIMISWDEKSEECECDENEDDSHCWTHYFLEIEEITPYTKDDLSLNLLTPSLGTTNQFYDITNEGV